MDAPRSELSAGVIRVRCVETTPSLSLSLSLCLSLSFPRLFTRLIFFFFFFFCARAFRERERDGGGGTHSHSPCLSVWPTRTSCSSVVTLPARQSDQRYK